MLQDLARVADDEHGADRLAFAAFAADFDGQVDDGLERFERHAGFELPQVAGGEPAQVFVELDEADRVDRIGLEAAIDHDHAGAGGEEFAGHAGEQGLRQLLEDRRIGHVQHDRGQAGFGGAVQLVGGVGGHDDFQAVDAGVSRSHRWALPAARAASRLVSRQRLAASSIKPAN